MLLSVTALKVPRVVDNVIVPPVETRLFPLASFNCTVTVEVVTPSAMMLEGDAVISDVATDAAPGVILKELEFVPVRPALSAARV